MNINYQGFLQFTCVTQNVDFWKIYLITIADRILKAVNHVPILVALASVGRHDRCHSFIAGRYYFARFCVVIISLR